MSDTNVTYTNHVPLETQRGIKKLQFQMGVMQAYLEGQTIQIKVRGGETESMYKWVDEPSPAWNWGTFHYRVKPIVDPTPWKYIPTEYEYVAKDRYGDIYFYVRKPVIDRDTEVWDCGNSECFRGTILNHLYKGIPWDKSLFKRPSE